MASDPAKTDAEALIPLFRLEELLNQDQAGRRTVLKGSIHAQPALLIVERAPFPTTPAYFTSVTTTLSKLRCLNANDVYSWHLAISGARESLPAPTAGDSEGGADFFADLKINLIYPCTEMHLKKYARQAVRFVTETPEIYATHVKPYMERKRAAGRLNWVYNIIEGRAEVDDVVFRTPLGEAGNAGDEGFLLTPDLNWDRTTLESLRLLALVERRDIWSIRDLRRRHVPWLRHIKDAIVAATVAKYPPLEPDQIKLYFHYQPTYYHLHIHVVNAATEAGATQATGKAVSIESVMELLEAMDDKVADEKGVEGVSLSYTIGEAHELWTDVFEPLKSKEKEPALRGTGTVSQ